ncbi:MAG TPA: hypothetical protein VNQ90_02065 [Chthoniobacteraceae bacterium]|nr:hypothetical protein [Chthoniobacteraceae bacterium]
MHLPPEVEKVISGGEPEREMNHPPLPGLVEWLGRWQKERLVRAALPVARALGLAMLLFLAVLVIFSPPRPLLVAMAIAVAVCWMAAIGFLGAVYRRRPPPGVLARRVDAILNLPDDLLALAEWPAQEEAWHRASWQRSHDRLATLDARTAWPVPIPRPTLLTGAATLLLTLGIGAVGWVQWQKQTAALAREGAARQERQALSLELFEDWKGFVELTDDTELKQLFTEAARLQEALQARDPMEAMLEMNRIDEAMAAMESAVRSDGISSQAEAMAEVLEAFEGMGALGAALRRGDFDAAAREAGERVSQLESEPDARAALRRDAAVAEMLATQSLAARRNGHGNLSRALEQLAATAGAKKESIPQRDLVAPTKTLRNEFAQEARRQNRGRMAGLARQQLETLRRRLTGENPRENPFPSLCLACNGPQPGSGTTGQAQGEATRLAEATREEALTGTIGEGESETGTLSASSGSGAVQAATKPTRFSDYVELSRKAVADENLPLAHRRVIRTYFERIRPLPHHD